MTKHITPMQLVAASTRPAMPIKPRPAPAFNPNSVAHKDDGFPRLLKMLSFKRPHGSPSEALFVERFITPYQPETFTNSTGMPLAYVITVPNPDGTASRTLFSCHVDTVHYKEGTQVPMYKEGWVFKEDDACLGADDGAGVWLLLEMIDRNVPGAYIFHRGEERGGIGSKGMADYHTHFLEFFERAVAFDRKSIGSVITHQSRGRCCSDKFANALADAFNGAIADEFAYFLPDDGGIYTDTAEYVGIIPECTNISCGYEWEHTPDERLNVDYLLALRDACCTVDWDTLPSEPFKIETYTPYGSFDYSDYSLTRSAPAYTTNVPSVDDIRGMSYSEIRQWAKKADSYDIAEIIEELCWQLQEYEDGLTAVEDAYDKGEQQ